MNYGKNSRIAWLLPTAWFYWQPTISELTKLFPQTKVFTALWPGFARGFENALDVEVVGQRKIIELSHSETGYGSNFTYLSPSIVKHLFQFQPDVIFSSSFGVWTVLALLFKPLGRWRVVIAYEGSAPSVDYRNSIVRLIIRRIMVRLADACITNSQQGKDYLIELLYANPSCVFAQPYEVPDPTSLLQINEEIESTIAQQLASLRRPIFLFVGSVIPRKGLQCLLEACSLLNQQGLHDYTLLVIGDGAQRQELESFCQTRQLNNNVHWLGRIEYSQIGSYFRIADVFVLPTFEDTWGMVILESMTFGKPILCSKRAGASDLVINEENGYVFEPDQPEELAELMNRLIKQPELIELMGEKSAQLIAKHTPKIAAEFLSKLV